MKSIRILFMSLLAVLVFTACEKENNSIDKNTIEVSGIEFVPNFFLNGGEFVGIDANVAAKALQNAGLNFSFSMSNLWQEGYEAAMDGPNKAFLTVAYTPERKDLFKWAGPTSQGMYGIFENGNTITEEFPLHLDKCKLLPAIGVVKDWLETTTLENMGFTNLVYYNTYSEVLAAFMSGEMPFIASDFYQLTSTLPKGYFVSNVMVVTRYLTVYYYMAFSKDVSDQVVNSVQVAIEKLIKDKSTVAIVRKYIPLMPEEHIAGSLQLFTEFSPPSSYTTRESIWGITEGSSVDILNEIQARSGYVNNINLTLWNDAYEIVQYLPNSAIFATARTPEREKLFQWVGPISPNRTYFYTLATSGLTIETLEQAKALESIGTPNGWFTHDFLVKNNFPNINVTSLTSQDAFNQLINGEVQALLMPDTDMKGLADMAEVSMNELTQHIKALDFDSYIAFSLNTPASTVQQWQSNLDAMKKDGKFASIWNEWFNGIPNPY